MEARLTWKVITPFSTVRVPLPLQASLVWNILLSVSKSAVYTPSGRAVSAAAEEAATEEATSELAAMEEAGAAVPPQPAREAASTTPARETVINCLQRIK